MYNFLMKLCTNYKYGIALFYTMAILLSLISIVISAFCWHYNLITWLPTKIIPIWVCVILGIIPGIGWTGIIAAIVTYVIF